MLLAGMPHQPGLQAEQMEAQGFQLPGPPRRAKNIGYRQENRLNTNVAISNNAALASKLPEGKWRGQFLFKHGGCFLTLAAALSAQLARKVGSPGWLFSRPGHPIPVVVGHLHLLGLP